MYKFLKDDKEGIENKLSQNSGYGMAKSIILTLRLTEIPAGEKQHIPAIPKCVHSCRSR